MSQLVLSFLMLSGTDSWRTDKHTLPVFALCKGSCNCNELQSGLFGMFLIFDANIWVEQAFWRTQWNDNPNFCHSRVILSPNGFVYLSQSRSCCLRYSLYVLSLCRSWPSPRCAFCFRLPPCHPPFSVSVSGSLQHRVQQWPTLSNRLMLASNTTQVICLSYLLYSLTPSICPFLTLHCLSLFCHISRHYDR